MKLSMFIGLAAIITVVCIFWGCTRKSSSVQSKSRYAPNVSASELLQRLAKQDQTLFLLDVRQPEELSGVLGALPGVVNIPLGQIQKRMSEVPKDKEVIIICRSGNRSGQATMFLRRNGFDNLRNLTGGMNAVRAISQP